MHTPIHLSNISSHINNQILFDEFSTIIYPTRSKIAIIGSNGTGKTSLLNEIFIKLQKENIHFIKQNLENHENLSGGEIFNHALSQCMKEKPDILLLDEPTNHLDDKNRSSLFKFIDHFNGILLIASHDIELLENHVDILWHIKNKILSEISALSSPKIGKITFHLKGISNKKDIINIKNGSIGYSGKACIIRDINFILSANKKIALLRSNGSGKSSFIRAILHSKDIARTGDWVTPKNENIGYLDQHYNNLANNSTILEMLAEQKPLWSHNEYRDFLNKNLFRKNYEVNNKICNLSGGERARLSLALIAANTPSLLILDEITNNLDLETKKYVTVIL